MSARPSLFAIILALVPGLGHLWLGRAGRGLAYFAAVSGLANIAFLIHVSGFAPYTDLLVRAALIAALTVALVSILEVARVGFLQRLSKARRARAAWLAEGLVHLRRGETGQARARFERVLDGDPLDGPARLQMARLELEAGQLKSARAHAVAGLRGQPKGPLRHQLESFLAEIRRSTSTEKR